MMHRGFECRINSRQLHVVLELIMATLPTLADLLEHLGDISPRRVRYQPLPGTATEHDVLEIKSKENRLFELVEGVLVEKARGFWESVLAGAILSALRAFVIPRKLGVVAGPDGMVRLFPDMNLIRMPDVAFISWERLAASATERHSVPQVAPDLAIEVLSEGNTLAEMQRKRQEYFAAGVRLVWIVDATGRTIDAYTAVDQRVTFREGQSLDGGLVLPGFALELTALFAEMDR